MDKRNAVIFVCADETHFGGERDCMKALAADIEASGHREDTAYFFCKQNSISSTDAEIMPLSNTEYAAIPASGSLPVQGIADMGSVNIVAVGHSTLKGAVSLSDVIARKTSSPLTLNYITHLVGDKADLTCIADRNITVFTPSSRAEIAALDATLAAQIRLIHLDAMPHTNSEASCKIDYDAYMNSPAGRDAAQIVNDGEPFAFAVLNAGFPIDGRHVPYTVKEAQEHGAALGRTMPAGTHLILAHGGPRNLLDEQAGQNTMDAFAEAYQAAQAERDAQPKVIKEGYKSGLPYNVIKAGYLLSHASNCLAFISNGEGYGTMDGAVLHVDNQKKLLGMFPFKALYADTSGQRQANIEKYNRKGVGVFRVEKGNLVIGIHPQQIGTPCISEDAAHRIVRDLRLAAASPKARPRPRV